MIWELEGWLEGAQIPSSAVLFFGGGGNQDLNSVPLHGGAVVPMR